jgi:regulator of RNase E activity RraA
MSGTWDPEVWASLSCALVSDCLERFQAMDAGVRRLSGGRLLGRAVPVRTMVGESATLHAAVQQAPAGAVLVIDAEGHLGRAVWGEVLTVAAQAAGLSGVVIDGVIRDVAAIRERGFPVFARGSCPAGPHKGWKGEIGQPVTCGGVVTRAGDLVVGDDDGVVVVPSERIADVAAAAQERLRTEAEWLRRIESGETSVDVLGLKTK